MARVLMLGRLADTAGWREREFDGDTLSSLRATIGRDEPHLARELDSASVVVVVDDVPTRGDVAIGEGDEVAFLPPMSGG